MIIDFQGVSKRFKQGHQSIEVLKNLNLKVDREQTLAIVGESGSGKTTLLSIMAGLEVPSEVYCQILGKEFTKLNENEITEFRGKNMGIVFQSYYLVPYLTALENVLLPLEIIGQKSDEQLAMDLLAKVQLEHRYHHFFHELSGGEAQRVALARALIHRPSLILADEPSGNLDEKTGLQVMDLLFELIDSSKSTLILVTHNRSLANRCQRVVELKQGQLVDIK